MSSLHLIRPLWLLAFIPFIFLLILVFKSNSKDNPWIKICDEHLIKYLLVDGNKKQSILKKCLFLLPLFFIIIALTGPSWKKTQVSAIKTFEPYVIVLDMSEEMFHSDLSPSRFKRAKFKLKELLHTSENIHFAMIVYTKEPFVVSPLTEDANTILQLMDALTDDIMPVQGQRLDLALINAQELIEQAGFDKGNVLVLTASAPGKQAIDEAQKLALNNIFTSIMPVVKPPFDSQAFMQFAKAGKGRLLTFTDNNKEIKNFIQSPKNQFEKEASSHVLIWEDEGIWFLIPALFLLLPAFRRGLRIK